MGNGNGKTEKETGNGKGDGSVNVDWLGSYRVEPSDAVTNC